MKDLSRVVLVAIVFVVVTIANVMWLESRSRAVSTVPSPDGAVVNGVPYRGATDTIQSYQTTFWLIEAGALVICLAAVAAPGRRV